MPNKNSRAQHQAIRTCVVCRQRYAQEELMSFFFLDGKLVFDLGRYYQTRKRYLCSSPECLSAFPNYKRKLAKKMVASAPKGDRP
ncbi:MAG: DUF448 domain-containing protein [Candidatus Cloacimonadaceae bacterium]